MGQKSQYTFTKPWHHHCRSQCFNINKILFVLSKVFSIFQPNNYDFFWLTSNINCKSEKIIQTTHTQSHHISLMKSFLQARYFLKVLSGVKRLNQTQLNRNFRPNTNASCGLVFLSYVVCVFDKTANIEQIRAIYGKGSYRLDGQMKETCRSFLTQHASCFINL